LRDHGRHGRQSHEQRTKAIYGHVGQLVEAGRAFEIKPSEVETLSQEPDYANGIWALVSLDLARLDDPPQD